MKTFSLSLNFPVVRRIRHLPGTLRIADYRLLMGALEVEDQSSYDDEEIPEITTMALQDCGPRAAVAIVLSTLFKDQFTPGQVQNLSEELKEESAWDEYSDLVDHRSLYICTDILNTAFPVDYPVPSHTHLQIVAKASELDSFLSKHPLDEAMLLRGIAQSEDNNCLLSRLFSRQLSGNEFPEAKWIIWRMETNIDVPDQRVIDCYGSTYWFRGIESGMKSIVELAY